MNQQEVMQKVKELADAIGKSQHPTNTLEIALLKSKCVELYEHIQILVPLAIEMPDPVKQSIEEIKPLIDQQINAPEIVAESVLTPTPPAIPEIQPEETIPPPTNNPITDTPLTNNPPHKEQPILQDILSRTSKTQNEEPLLHERISQNNPKTEMMQGKVESLKSAISLNKKIAFVNVLFNENTVEYTKAIDRLNSSLNIDEAMRLFTELKHQYSWDSDHDLAKELQSLVEKRFG
ncbi:MAG: hypothetical protein WC760_12765 [Bacteroidia bacterium]|jgi:hypothetical protein